MFSVYQLRHPETKVMTLSGCTGETNGARKLGPAPISRQFAKSRSRNLGRLQFSVGSRYGNVTLHTV